MAVVEGWCCWATTATAAGGGREREADLLFMVEKGQEDERS